MNKRARKLHVQEGTNRNKFTTFGTPRLQRYNSKMPDLYMYELQGYCIICKKKCQHIA